MMMIDEDSPSIADPRATKRRKKVQLTFCRSLLETPPKSPQPRCSSPSICSTAGGEAKEPRKKLYGRESSAPSTPSSPPPTSTASHVDLVFLLSCDAICQDFLMPHFSFHELLALERTSKAVRDVVRRKRWWQVKVDRLRGADDRADQLLSRYSSSLSLSHPEYHKKMISKYLTDTSKVVSNIRASSCRKCCKFFSLEGTCHKAFTVDSSAKFVFLQEEGEVCAMELTTNKSRRGVELRPLTTFSVVQADQYCSMLATHHQLLFHVTYQQLHVWNWQKQGQRVEVTHPSETDLMGLGLARAVIIRANRLIIGSNDSQPSQPTTGAALITIWQMDCHNVATDNQISFKPENQISVRPQKEEMPSEFGAILGMKPTSISLDGDDGVVAVALGLYCFSQTNASISIGQVVFYDIGSGKTFGWRQFPAAASCVRVDSRQRKAIVGLEKRDNNDLPYVVVVDIDSGDTLKRLRSKMWGARCLWTDWKRLVFTGDDDGLVMWDVAFGKDDLADKRLVDVDEVMATQLSGSCNGLPVTDRICDIVFDGFHLVVYTRGSSRAAVRLLDFLKLNSIKF